MICLGGRGDEATVLYQRVIIQHTKMFLSPENVRDLACHHDYQEVRTLDSRRAKFYHRCKAGCGGPVELEVHFLTGAVTTRLKHPRRREPTTLLRFVESLDLLDKIFYYPRIHTGRGVYVRD